MREAKQELVQAGGSLGAGAGRGRRRGQGKDTLSPALHIRAQVRRGAPTSCSEVRPQEGCGGWGVGGGRS